MRDRHAQYGGWEDDAGSAGADDEMAAASYDAYDAYEGADEGDRRLAPWAADGIGEDGVERGLMLSQEQSLVNISSTVTHHGAPLLSYSRTMNRFYTSRKQRLSLGRYRCEVCGERIRFWAWETSNGNRTHDGCYERLAWTWTNLYAQQQRLASEGRFE